MSKRKRSEHVIDNLKVKNGSPKKPRVEAAIPEHLHNREGGQFFGAPHISLAKQDPPSNSIQVRPSKENDDITQEKASASHWVASGATGGRLLDLDPIFSGDEQHILLAYTSCVRVFAINTSLPLRALVTSSKSPISSFTLSAQDPSTVYIALSCGKIEQWDWKEGRRIIVWDVKAELFDLKSVKLHDDNALEVILVADRSKSKSTITAHSFQKSDGQTESEVRTLFEAKIPVRWIRVALISNVVVAATEKHLIVGTPKRGKTPRSLNSVSYTWRVLDYSLSITALDLRSRDDDINDSKELHPLCDVAVGTSNGSIFLYKDILNQLNQVENRQQTVPHSSTLHWHRNPVGSLHFSKDGNYLISGGLETVLVLWQLDTGRKQLLPHLSSSLESVVVSPTGSSYGIRLADNSVMVLSTSELTPTVHIPGIQLSNSDCYLNPGANTSCTPYSVLTSVLRKPLAITVTPESSRLMLTVPSGLSSRIGVKQGTGTPYLQTIDPRTGTGISKQAIARTKITDRIESPDGTIIDEPSVTFIRVSQSGKWLATVDEWIPPQNDFAHKSLSVEDMNRERELQMEIYLKFWSWDEQKSCWELVWRVEGPHMPERAQSNGPGMLLDLIHDPNRDGFISLGQDGSIKAWYPKSRTRHGLQVRDNHGASLTSWSSMRIGIVPIPRGGHDREHPLDSTTGFLAASRDGTVVAASIDVGHGSRICTFSMDDPDSMPSYSELLPYSIAGLGILDKYLVIVGSCLSVWDLVNDTLTFAIQLNNRRTRRSRFVQCAHLAIDPRGSTFAVVTDTGSERKGSTMAIFYPQSPSPVYCANLKGSTLALLPLSSHRGYVTVNQRAEMHMFTPAKPLGTPESNSIKEAAQDMTNFTALDKIFSTPHRPDSSEISKLSEVDLRDRTSDIVGESQVTDIWSSTSAIALPHVSTIFTKVATLVSRKQSTTS